MFTLEKISPRDSYKLLNAKQAFLVDVREEIEQKEERIDSSLSFPLSSLDSSEIKKLLSQFKESKREKLVITCKSGARAEKAANKIIEILNNCPNDETNQDLNIYVILGGIDAWKSENLPLHNPVKSGSFLTLNRQIQIVTGSLVLLGVILGIFVSKIFLLLSAFIGTGLLFAGLTGFCGLGLLLAKMPWNKNK